MRVLFLSAAIVGSVLALTGCNKKESVTGPTPGTVALTGNLAFGNVTVSSTAASTLTITNTGMTALTVTSVSYPAGFSGNWSSGTIAAGAQQGVVVTFAPSAATTYSGNITVTATELTAPSTIAVSGTGVVIPTFTLTGTITETPPTTSTTLAGARVTFVDGANAGKFGVSNAQGVYQIPGVTNGGYTVIVELVGYISVTRPVGIDGNTTLNIQLSPTGPRTGFNAGVYRVGVDIPPGRYFADPVRGCNWKRLSGFGGTPGEVLSSAVIEYDAGQWIVDLLSTDVGFQTDPNCGRWSTTTQLVATSLIKPGKWLVGAQIVPGVYRASAGAGCYWERLNRFTGESGDVIANLFVSSAGTQLVSIAATDVGFLTNDVCGDWNRVSP
jgi:HYDIN/CFA65/VesB-like, Ig-like domain/Carboxypeptidase regulatory-like domain